MPLPKPLHLFLMAATMLTGCSDPPDNSDLLATVGSKDIRTADLQAEIDRRKSARRPIPPLADLLAEMVDYEVLLQNALAASLDNDPAVQRTYHNLLIGTLKDNQLRPGLDAASVTDEEITAHYQANQDDYRLPARTRLAVIFVAVDSRASDSAKLQARQRAEQALALATADADGFKKAAVKFSDDQSSRYKGGDIGWIRKGTSHSRIPVAVSDAANALEIGEISKILEGNQGFYLAKPIAREPESHRPVDQVQASIASSLLKEKRAKVTADFHARLKAASNVKLFSERLEQLGASDPPLPDDPTPPQF